MDPLLLDSPRINLIPLEGGRSCSQRTIDLVETIRERWGGRVDVLWNPGRNPEFGIVEVLPGREEIIFWVDNEASFDGRVLEKLIMADNSQGNVLDRLDAQNAAVEAIAKKKYQDVMDEAHDIAKHVMKSPLNKYVVDENVTIRDYGNRIK
jgi:hypothetical protein